MSRSRSRSSTESLAAAALALALAACADDGGTSCGFGAAPPNGITATIDGEVIRYTSFTSSVNNDCTLFDSGVISITIQGVQEGVTPDPPNMALCLPRPDLLGSSPSPLAPSRVPPDPSDRVQLFDVSAVTAAGCTVTQEVATTPTGTAAFDGYCEGGTSDVGYALTLDGSVPVVVTCTGMPARTTTAFLAGTAAIVAE